LFFSTDNIILRHRATDGRRWQPVHSHCLPLADRRTASEPSRWDCHCAIV